LKLMNKCLKLLAGLIALAVMGTVGFGAVWSWNSHQTSQENNFQSRTVSVKVNEDFPDPTVTSGSTQIKVVSIENTGTDAAFVRVGYSEGWTTETAQLEGTGGVQKNWTSSWLNDWTDGGDGWYYYKKILPAGESVQILSSVTFPAVIPGNADYNLNFMVETAQVSDQAEVNTAATQKLFGKAGTISGATIADGAVIAGAVSWS
jgi:hypothetical protein